MSMSRMKNQRFTSSGSWTCPAGVSQIIVWGMGGANGGQAGGDYDGGADFGGRGGIATNLLPTVLDVVPNTVYTVTIGAGGAGGASDGDAGADGGDTSFGALMVWEGIMGDINDVYGFYANSLKYDTNNAYVYLNPKTAQGRDTNVTGQIGYPGGIGVSAAAGTSAVDAGGGGASGMSSNLSIGGTGGTGVVDDDGGNGGDAPANSGAGGGGGAGAGNVAGKLGGSGGAGGSGLLIVSWVE